MKIDKNFNLPEDYIAFLRRDDVLEYDYNLCEPGRVILTPLEKLEIGFVEVDSEESPLEENDPNAGINGYYKVPAVNLISECEDYSPEFILLWLPNEHLFGTYDIDHNDLLIFPNTNWTDIVRNPIPYLNSQWDVNTKVTEYFKPYPDYEFIKGVRFD